MTKSTLNDFSHSADICRERGWVAGTRIVGDGDEGPKTIEITAIGKHEILAYGIHGSEQLWSLNSRDWQEVSK